MEWWEKEGEWFDCFKILGISENASEGELKKAYHAFVNKYHPDVNNNETELFKRGTLAYKTLRDTKTREKYTKFTKKLKAERANNKKEDKEETMSFEENVNEYKRKESQIKIAINGMIHEIEQKREKFNSIYISLCQALKNKSINANDYEIRRQKLRSFELSSINSIKEIEDIIEHDLNNLDLTYEQKKLRDLRKKFRQTEKILTSSYDQAIIKLKKAKLMEFSPYAALIMSGIIISTFFYNLLDFGSETPKKSIVAEYDGEKIEDEEKVVVNETLEPTTIETDPILDITQEGSINFDYYPDCVLFQNIPSEDEYVSFSNVYTECGMEVIIADDEYGVSYLLDANNHNNVLFGNFISYGGPYHSEDGFYFCILSADGYDYKLDAYDCRTILEVESAYSEESEPYYLEGYGYVIEAYNCGEKYLIDAETRYPFIRNFDDYEPMYYDEELGCNVYCFNKYGGDCKYYLAADDLRKVLKKESVWD